MPEQSKTIHAPAGRTSAGFLPHLPLPGAIPDKHVAIADMADAFGVTHRTLHFYEEKGLLTADRMGPMRVYGLEDIRRMTVINACREIDMPIAEISGKYKGQTPSGRCGSTGSQRKKRRDSASSSS